MNPYSDLPAKAQDMIDGFEYAETRAIFTRMCLKVISNT
jgi:hypothetical protein